MAIPFRSKSGPKPDFATIGGLLHRLSDIPGSFQELRLRLVGKPANDLSRGCSAEDIFNVAVVTALQSERG